MSVINFIKKFKKNPKILFTTPSHGQGVFAAPEAMKMLGRKYYSCDYSEADGFDNLANPQGIIRTATEETAGIYGAKSLFFLVNGSTSGIIASMIAVLNKGDKVLIARNCHKSVYNGLVLTGAVPVWIMPSYNEEWDIYEGIHVDTLDDILSENKDIKAFIMTNPTYEGYMSDISRISAVCKKHGVILIVDEAHGALWNFCKSIGTPSLEQGADIVVQSLHKTAGAINPSAILMTGSDAVSPDKIQEALNIFTTTSPSYPVMLNIEATIKYLSSTPGRRKVYSLLKDTSKFIRNITENDNVHVYSDNNDMTKILIKIENLSGKEFSNILYEDYDIECELYTDKAVLLLTGVGTDKHKLKKAERAIEKIASENIKIFPVARDSARDAIKSVPRVRYTPAALWKRPSKDVELKYAVSRVAMELITDYPPGIPVLIPGEVIRKEHIAFLQASGKEKIKVLM